MLFRTAEMRRDAKGILRVRTPPALAQRRPSRFGRPASLLMRRLRMSKTCCASPARPCCPSMQAWSDGGYSDDLTVASKCTEQHLVIYCPGYSIFPQW